LFLVKIVEAHIAQAFVLVEADPEAEAEAPPEVEADADAVPEVDAVGVFPAAISACNLSFSASV